MLVCLFLKLREGQQYLAQDRTGLQGITVLPLGLFTGSNKVGIGSLSSRSVTTTHLEIILINNNNNNNNTNNNNKIIQVK